MNPTFKEGETCPLGTISLVQPVIYGEQVVDHVYEIDGDGDQRYTTDELLAAIEEMKEGGR